MKLSVKILLKLIFDAKKQGKGRQGRGRIYSRLISILTIGDNSVAAETFGGNIDRFLLRLLRNETEYPYQLFNTEIFAQCIGDFPKAEKNLLKMRGFINSALDNEKLDVLTGSLLEVMKSDSSVRGLIWGSEIIEKEALLGSRIHPRQVCVEALLLAALHHVHRFPADDNSDVLNMGEIPEIHGFRAVRYEDKNSLLTDVPLALSDHIRDNSERFSGTLSHKLTMKMNGVLTDHLPDENLFLSGVGGSGKTAFLRSLTVCDDRLFLFLDRHEIRTDILTEILLKYRYAGVYSTEHDCILAEGERTIVQERIQLEQLFREKEPDGVPHYVLIIDGLDSANNHDIFAEISAVLDQWKNVRFILSGRKKPEYSRFTTLSNAVMLGVSDEELEGFDAGFKGLLRRPLLLRKHLEDGENYSRAGQLLDFYYQEYEVRRSDSEPAHGLMIKHFLPFVARRMAELNVDSLRLSEVAETLEKSVDFLLGDRNIYLNYAVPKGIKKEALPQGRDELIRSILETGILLPDESGELSFESRLHRNYFAARSIINAIEMLEISFDSFEINEKSRAFSALNLGEIWFSDEENYKLIGEIAGDHKNTQYATVYCKTQLDALLKMCREFECFRATENIITAMAAVRNYEVCDVYFSETSLPLIVPSYIRFSDKSGELPCDFNGCKVMYLGLLEPLRFCAHLADKRLTLAAFENAYFVLWDNEKKRILWEIDLHRFTDIPGEFDYAEFSENDKFILIHDLRNVLKICTETGELCEKFSDDELYSDETPDSTDDLSELHRAIISQLPHFRNCDFRRADFMFEHYRELLALMGAEVDAP